MTEFHRQDLQRWHTVERLLRASIGLLVVATSALAVTSASSRQASADERGKSSPKMVTVPGGGFMMGNPDWKTDSGHDHEGPTHRVRISKFLLGTHEVTQAQWKAVMKTNPSEFSSKGKKKSEVVNIKTDSFPVENINWYEAVTFCNQLSKREGLKPYYRLENEREEKFTFLGKTEMLKRYDVQVAGGNGYRLPTEAEWEYACRAETRSRYSFGDAANGSKANVNGKYPFGTSVKGSSRERPMPVGSFKPNAFGLYDMHGNVSELCVDERDDEAYSRRGESTVDPVVARRVIVGGSNTAHIKRGGNWQVGAKAATSYYRTSSSATTRNRSTGFRVARSITE